MRLARISRHPAAVVILIALLGAAAGMLYARYGTGGFRATLALTLDQRPRPITAEYDYDGYYALKASEAFGDTVAAWFGTPSFVAELYQAAGRPLPEDKVVSSPARIRTRRVSAQTVVVRFSDPDREAVQNLAAAASDLVALKTSRLALDTKGVPLFAVSAADLVITPNAVPPMKGAGAGLLAGTFFGILGAFLMKPIQE